MSKEASRYRDDEKTRPCTTCRMPVSILATKCRYCGAELGRPREETRSLTTQDLGGETIKHYAPSSNVMDALESFRTEQSAQQRKDAAGGAMPQLDARSRALASAARPPQTGPPRKAKRFTWGDYGRYVLGGVTAVLLVALAITIIPRFTTGQADSNAFVNRTPELIELGAAPLEVLQAAVEGMRRAPGPESNELYATARQMVRREVMGILGAPDWTRFHLEQASRMAQRASDIDPHQETQELKHLVDAEVDAYNIVLAGLDTAAGTVAYRAARSEAQVTAGRDDLILDRFRIVRVTSNSCRLRDQLRGGRELLWAIGGQPSQRQ